MFSYQPTSHILGNYILTYIYIYIYINYYYTDYMYVFLYICIYIYTYRYIYIYIHTHTDTHIYIYIHILIDIYIYAYGLLTTQKSIHGSHLLFLIWGPSTKGPSWSRTQRWRWTLPGDLKTWEDPWWYVQWYVVSPIKKPYHFGDSSMIINDNPWYSMIIHVSLTL